MPAQILSTVENNFTKGLVTEFTGLNFPENAATDTSNCEYTLVGDVIRREGFDYETNYSLNAVTRTSKAISTYKWNNAGGDGVTQVVVEQIGGTLYFYKSSAATAAAPLSTTKLASTIDISIYIASGGSFDATAECQYADGNGYLFVYHPSCDPLYCTYTAGTVTVTAITLQVRDFIGVSENLAVNSRPLTLSSEHQYNLLNQGWTQGSPWSTLSSSTFTPGTGSKVFTVTAGMTVTLGDYVNIINNHDAFPGSLPPVPAGTLLMSGPVTAYSGTSLTINVISFSNALGGSSYSDWQLNPVSVGYINTWLAGVGNYPSNADVWWYFKNSSGAFSPSTTVSNVTLGAGPAPKGHYSVNLFSQRRSLVSGVTSLTDVTTTVRPRTGCWFQGRVWYTGVDAIAPASGDANAYSWSESLYFSQIVQSVTDFGACYQKNDPTSQTLFDLLPSDGGIITIQGCGSIYKLFPLMNAMLVFAANGVWYISGSQGVGFAANDYTIVKLSAVKSISGTSFVDINGLPMFWNEEGIYSVEPAKQGTGLLNSPLHVNPLEVVPLTVGTILSFYNSIPLQSKKYARAAYNPIDYIVQWLYKSTNETSVTDRYTYDSILNLNTFNKAFFPYSIDISDATHPSINSIIYVSSPGGSTAPNSVFKYTVSIPSGGSHNFTFGEEIDSTFVDWRTPGLSTNYTSYFTTGFKLHGQGQRRFQIPYIYVFSRADTSTSYKIQGLWDYANTGNSGRWSVAQLVNNSDSNYGMIFKRHRIRGQGLVLQIKLTSADGQPFDIMGWSAFETQNAGV